MNNNSTNHKKRLSGNLVQSPNYGKQTTWDKFKRKLNSIIVNKIENTPLQFICYRSYWHYRLSKRSLVGDDVRSTHFLTLKPNHGAGIGHQLANWNAGLFFSRKFKIGFAHSPFSADKWESFLGFGEGESKASELLNSKHYKKIRLPKFNSEDSKHLSLIQRIVSSYSRPNVLFCLETDQGYRKQYETRHILSEKFFNATSRKNDQLVYSLDSFNLAIHIRRRMKIETEEVWKMRGLDNQYYVNVLRKVLGLMEPSMKVRIYLFSQGVREDFCEFDQFDNVTFCLDMGPVESFLHMVYADLLISSKSSFSYKPALISNKIQICPETFWHSYPKEPNYILANNEGELDLERLRLSLLPFFSKNVKR